MATPDRFALPQVGESTRKPEWLKVRLPHGDGYERVKAIVRETKLDTVAGARPNVIAHNIETVRRLTDHVRDRRATYDQSLRVLEYLKHSRRPRPAGTAIDQRGTTHARSTLLAGAADDGEASSARSP